MANLAQMVNVIAPVMTNKQGMFLQTTFFPIAEYSKQRGNVALTPFVSAPTYTLAGGQGGGRGPQGPAISYLDVSSTYNAADHAVYVNVLNRSKDKDLSTQIECQEGKLGSSVEVWQMNHPDLKATHAFGDDKKVVPSMKTMQAQLDRNGFRYNFPAHSLTILKLKVD
jgi:alpha-N-arabinofuranosidase